MSAVRSQSVKLRVPAGKAPEVFVPGSLVFTRRRGPYSKLIELGQRRRGFGSRSWTHVAGIVSANGDIVEALGRGVQRTNVRKYRDVEYVLVSPPMSEEDRAEVVAFLEAAVGRPYAFAEIASLAAYCLFGSERLMLSNPSTVFCSALQAEAQTRTTKIFAKDPWVIMPAELAREFGAPAA